ncbi:unnamed protein product [Closterium sp. NIES-53]
MNQSGLPKKYWPYAMNHVVRLHNLLSTTANWDNLSPHLKWTGSRGDPSMLRVWGCVVQYRPTSATTGKFTHRARWGVHLGLTHEYKGWLILDVDTNQIVPAHDILFYERLTLQKWIKDERRNVARAYASTGRSFTSPEDEATSAALDREPADEHPGVPPHPRDDDDDDDDDDAPAPGPSCHHTQPSTSSPAHESDDDDVVEVTTIDTAGTTNLSGLQLLSLHTIKQAPRLWQQHLHKILLEIGFTQLTHSPGLYPLHFNGDYILLTVYVDDLLYTGTCNKLLNQFEEILAQRVDITINHNVKQFLGLNITYAPQAIHLSASKYAEQLGEHFKILPAPLSTPYRNPSADYKLDNKTPSPTGLQMYQQQLGCLLFASVTCRPNLSYIANQLAQYSRKPVAENQLDLERTLQYFISTPDIGLSYSTLTTTSFNLNSYVDADHAADHANRRSRSGFFFCLEPT